MNFCSGITKSYAKILNGVTLTDKMKNYNELTASMASPQNKKQKLDKAAKRKKEEDDANKAENKTAKERKAKEKRDRILPTYKAHLSIMIDVQH